MRSSIKGGHYKSVPLIQSGGMIGRAFRYQLAFPIFLKRTCHCDTIRGMLFFKEIPELFHCSNYLIFHCCSFRCLDKTDIQLKYSTCFGDSHQRYLLIFLYLSLNFSHPVVRLRLPWLSLLETTILALSRYCWRSASIS